MLILKIILGIFVLFLFAWALIALGFLASQMEK